MSNKIKKYGAFLFYSYSIYNSYLIVYAILVLIRDIHNPIGSLILRGFQFVILPVYYLPDMFELFLDFISSPLRIIVYYSIPLFIILIFNLTVFYVWYKRQTILRAWLLAITGMLFSPGILFFVSAFGYGAAGLDGKILYQAVNIFYPGLFIVNAVQKFLWTDNRLFNTIRAILKWPCLKT